MTIEKFFKYFIVNLFYICIKNFNEFILVGLLDFTNSDIVTLKYIYQCKKSKKFKLILLNNTNCFLILLNNVINSVI